MTKRVFLENVTKGITNDEMIAFAAAELEKLDKANSARRDKAAEKAVEHEAERAPKREAIAACITDEPKTATMLIEEAGLELKPQSIPSLLKPLVETGEIEKVQVKIPEKKSKAVAYVRKA